MISSFIQNIATIINKDIQKGNTFVVYKLLVYKFVFARCNSCYIGETCRHFNTRMDEHVKKDKKCNIYINV